MSQTLLESIVQIRAMQQDDLEEVQAIDQVSFSMPWPLSAYDYELNVNKLSLLWVAETSVPDGKPQIVGMVVVWLIIDEVHVATIAVHPSHRGRGIAHKLLSTALRESIHRGMLSATLEVRTSNLIAQRLYLQFGFRVVGSRPRYYRDNNETALIMTCSNLEQAYSQWLASQNIRDRGL